MNSINRINSDKFILNIKKLKSQHFAKESRFFLHSPFKTPLKRANRKNNTPLGIIYTEIEKTKQSIEKEIKTTRENRKKLSKLALKTDDITHCIKIKNKPSHSKHFKSGTTFFTTPSKQKIKTDEQKLPSISSTDSSNFISSVCPARIKTFLISFIPNWYEKKKMAHIKLNKQYSLQVQQSTIKDEILLLMDNIQLFKVKYLSNKEIINIFKSQELRIKRKINKLLEETIGLMITTAYLLLMDLGDSVNNFIVNPQWRVSKEDNKVVKDEEEELRINGRIFSDSANFLKSCEEASAIISTQDDEFIFSKNDFEKIIQYLERARVNVSELLYTLQNLFRNYYKDKEIVEQYKKEMQKIKSKSSNKIIRTNYEGGIDYTKYKGPLTLSNNEEQEKRNRILKCLDREPKRKKRLRQPKEFNINSKIIDKLLNYATDGFKNMICCERIIRRFKEKEQFEKETNILYEI